MSGALKGRARVAPRWTASSDERRPRLFAIAAIAAVVASVVALMFAPRGTLSSPGPLSSPHAKNEVKCAACHAAPASGGGAATAGCRNCHGEHALRGGHARAFADGRMGCATCHPAHGAETVTLASGARVPVVRASSCAGCHDLSRAGDPLRPCVDAAGVLVRCMGEHDRGTTTPKACASQHTGSARFVARDEAARKITGTIAPPPSAATGHAAWLGLGPIAAGLVAFAGARLVRRRKSDADASRRAAPAPARRKLPVIDASRCLGCYACVDVCPFDVLEVERYVAMVARPDACCGVVACAEACPNGSLTIREEGDTPLGPRLSPSYESEAAPGVFLAGDVTGVPLIKNAIVQASAAVDALHARMKSRERPPREGDVDAEVLIVGAGPAGLAASLRAHELGVSYVTLEQSTIAASIKSFPRGKLVFDAPVDLPLEGEIAVRECTKEELIAHWTRIVRTRKPRILEQHRVVSCERDAGAGTFVVSYERADASRGTLRVRSIVVAIGQRGTPRRLDATIAPGAETMVADALFDARSFTGKRVVVVGLGDSAMEAAQALAHQPGTEVTLVHRGDDFSRGRAKNVAAIKSLVEAGRIALRLRTAVIQVEPGRVRLSRVGAAGGAGAAESEVEADAVLALLGGVPSTALLEKLGVISEIVSDGRASKGA